MLSGKSLSTKWPSSSACANPEIKLMAALLEMMVPVLSTSKIPSGAAFQASRTHSPHKPAQTAVRTPPPTKDGIPLGDSKADSEFELAALMFIR